MALTSNTREPVANGEEPPLAPLAGSRAQSIQRLQVGLFGLGVMVLIVGLANIIMNNAQRNQAEVVPEAIASEGQEASAEPVSDALAEAGVVPEVPAPPTAGEAAAARGTGNAPPRRP